MMVLSVTHPSKQHTADWLSSEEDKNRYRVTVHRRDEDQDFLVQSNRYVVPRVGIKHLATSIII